jgi:hypothetical protein
MLVHMATDQHTTNTNLLSPVKHVAALFTACTHTLYVKILLGDITSYRFWAKVLLDVHEMRAALLVPTKVEGDASAA